MGRTSFIIQDDLEEWIEERLSYGESKSGWYRYAVETTHALDQRLDTLYEPYQYEERSEFIEQAVEEKIKKVRQDANYDK